MTWIKPQKALQNYKCPAMYCKVVGVKGDVCPKHKVPLVLTFGYKTTSKYWLRSQRPLDRSLRRRLVG